MVRSCLNIILSKRFRSLYDRVRTIVCPPNMWGKAPDTRHIPYILFVCNIFVERTYCYGHIIDNHNCMCWCFFDVSTFELRLVLVSGQIS